MRLLFVAVLILIMSGGLASHAIRSDTSVSRNGQTKEQKASKAPVIQGKSVGQPEPSSKSDGRFKVDILSQPEPKTPPDSSWFIFYVLVTVIGVIVNAAVLFAIWRQTKINWRQTKINLMAARAARGSARAAQQSGKQTGELIQQATKQVVTLRIAAKAARKQADAAQITATAAARSAEAALLNAQFIVKAERAWVLLSDIERTLMIGPQYSTCIVRILNYGNTPAKVMSSRFAVLVGIKGSPPNIAGFFAQPDVSTTDVIPPNSISTHEGSSGPLTPEQAAELQQNNKAPWVCGIIKYHDVFEGPQILRETRFCYKRGPNFAWVPDADAPSDYNRAT